MVGKALEEGGLLSSGGRGKAPGPRAPGHHWADRCFFRTDPAGAASGACSSCVRAVDGKAACGQCERALCARCVRTCCSCGAVACALCAHVE